MNHIQWFIFDVYNMNVICESKLNKYNVLSHKTCAVYLACYSTLLITSHQQFVKHVIAVKTITYSQTYAGYWLSTCKTHLILEMLIFVEHFFILKISFKIYFLALVSVPYACTREESGGATRSKTSTRLLKL